MTEQAPPQLEIEGIELSPVEIAAPLAGVAPEHDPDLAVRRLGSPHAADPHSYFLLQVLQDALAHGAAEGAREVGGVLLGRQVQGLDSVFSEVTNLLPALSDDAGRTHITFTHEAWDRINAAVEADPEGLQIVGWYHSHPGFGPFFSAHDRFIHESFFTDPFHVGLVLDAQQQQLSLYGWRRGDLVRFGGLHVVAPKGEAEALETLLREAVYVAEASRMGTLLQTVSRILKRPKV